MGEKCIYNYNIEFIFLFPYFYLMLHRKIEQNKLQKILEGIGLFKGISFSRGVGWRGVGWGVGG